MNIILTGANGLLGKVLQTSLVREHQVFALVRQSLKVPIPGIHYIITDFSQQFSYSHLPKQVDAIIHLAQSTYFREFPDKALDIFNVNIASTAYLLNYARQANIRIFIYASSGGVYGNSHQPFHENSPIVPPGKLGYYLGSKLCSEVLVQSYAAFFQVIVLRFFFMYGPGQRRSMLIPRLMDSVKYHRPITLQGVNGIRINPIHVLDAAAAAIATLNSSESATFNIAGPEVLSLRQIAETMGNYLNIEPQFQTISGEPRDLIGDNTAMCEKLQKPTRQIKNYLNDII
ncbi:NAD(P)-dependent oxidoreductase [Candidatus Synechococcus calcipolaris G9]|uniref:NAD(P)-dependent oxidoreductase n=1 Tax=Candidatus Synechococcus calcipolaris G9 TaxID=1497997 RepID=A0ABT6EW52_9SYNE|nr:NAD(P)-dependent oxidoreductase [Candidatus Synechococcus calcipolaris]MDG2989985.1 NAD(P)-dependent oxidoreductase [Candidatus Synechococcus calcipolaris G9]